MDQWCSGGLGGGVGPSSGTSWSRLIRAVDFGRVEVVAFDDRTAVGALCASCERNLRAPDDLPITGFDGTDPGRGAVPRLTTVGQPPAEMGRMAVPRLMRAAGAPHCGHSAHGARHLCRTA
ncbi:substrate-binding domain-containing protein [Streptomyces sp900116325]|uniref:substrate-binding domain-containing protein n=1 Tax=Streptomyces sp. 900116325 TaxID=3154295 RepID=UPI0033B6F2F1